MSEYSSQSKPAVVWTTIFISLVLDEDRIRKQTNTTRCCIPKYQSLRQFTRHQNLMVDGLLSYLKGKTVAGYHIFFIDPTPSVYSFKPSVDQIIWYAQSWNSF